ncbi:hypothetical protein FNU79_12770 [Deinococcus detaillensis]|uniref:DUF3616 domain-containing protein n=1 Tax=Deinococcus detaillensis TaxID=2592048 RepID=A0A553URY3_9DEIO|nr:hypothetical protein [Deinococcus detaillensis]TSA82989.1 hypothetical protein FNU79_12770 [Deinococcus detaillensis]
MRQKLHSKTRLLALLLGVSSSVYALNLPTVNCSKDASNVRCTLKDSNQGKIGSGLPFNLGGLVKIGSGYVDAASNSVMVPVEFGGQQDNQGVVMRVDLATGNRSVVSGYDGEEWHGSGVKYVSDKGQSAEAYDLGRVEVVRPGPSGSILALVDKGLQQRTEIIKIDSKTGNRTLIWASRVFNDAAPSGPSAIRDIEKSRFNQSSDSLCKGGDKTSLKPAETFEADAQNLYLMMVNNPSGTGAGLVKVPLAGGSCTWVSQYFADGTSQVGSGATINTLSPLVFASALVGGEFVTATGPNPSGNTLLAVNTKDGTRRTISLKNVQTPARSKGSGDAQVGYLGTLATGGAGIATIRTGANDDYSDVVLIDPASGDRTLKQIKVGSLSSGRDSDVNIVAAIPGTKQYVVSFKKVLHIWDAATGTSWVLSQ